MSPQLRIESLNQELSCPTCRKRHAVSDCPHGMNFTTGNVRFICPNCRTDLGRLSFQRWNALHRRAEIVIKK